MGAVAYSPFSIPANKIVQAAFRLASPQSTRLTAVFIGLGKRTPSSPNRCSLTEIDGCLAQSILCRATRKSSDVVIPHWFDDMHPKHEATLRVLRRAFVCGFSCVSLDDSKPLLGFLDATPRIHPGCPALLNLTDT